MSSDLSSCLLRKIRSIQSQTQNVTPPEDPKTPPPLPAQRALTITPSPSQEHLSVYSSTSPFFRLLPPLIRRRILIEAFGERTLHIDLVYDHPPKYLDHSPRGYEAQVRQLIQRGQWPHCGVELGTYSWRNRDTKYPKAWRWFSCVCHRDGEWDVRERAKGRENGVRVMTEPHQDICLDGMAQCCQSWRGEMPGKCFVGAMGWLLACRLACVLLFLTRFHGEFADFLSRYNEGIDVLYSTNSFHISNHKMMHALPNQIRDRHRAMITSVEIVWKFLRDPRESILDQFEVLLQRIPQCFPQLRNLYLYPSGLWKTPMVTFDDDTEEFENDVLELIDGMVRKIGPQLLVCDFVMPLSKFNSHWESSMEKGYRYEHGGPTRSSRRIWRPLAPIQQEIGSEEVVGTGYWIREGPDDTLFPFGYAIPYSLDKDE